MQAATKAAATTVLLVEDNEDNILTVADYLTFKSYHVVVARNGLGDCFEPAGIGRTRRRPDGYSDAELDGVEAIRRLRRMPGWSQKPIVALTAMAMAGDRVRYASQPAPTTT